MSFLNGLPELTNLQDPEFSFVVTNLLNKVDGVKKDNVEPPFTVTSKKYDIILTFLNAYKTHIGPDIYPTVRLVIPNKDRRLYFMKATELISFIVKLYKIPKRSSDEKYLKEWKINHHNYQKLSTSDNLDLPSKIAKVISNKRGIQHKSTKSYTVSEINDVLDKLTTVTKNDDRIELLKPVLDNLKIDEIRWFLNIILRNSNLGFLDKLFFEAWNPNCYKLFIVCNNLEKTFKYFSINETILPEKLIPQVGFPFQPQASHKLTLTYEKLCENMPQFYIEEKVDGDRMILHYDNGQFKYFTRRIRDYTLVYGENFQTGSLSRHLKQCFHPSIKKIILDGEMVAWDNIRQCILPFGTLKLAAVQEAVVKFSPTDAYEEQGCSPLFLVFDILQVNDTSLVHVPLKQRKQALQKAITDVPHKLEILPYNLCEQPSQIENAVKGVIVDRSEGIMVKNTKSTYHWGSRDNSWIKVKPEYLDLFGENIDVVIIGITPGRKNSYMCGLYDTEEQIWRSFCTVANGFTNDEFKHLNEFFMDKILPETPENVVFGKKKPIQYVNPENSIVLEIKARSYDQRTDETYATETTLRNLYCRSIRDNKSYDDCILYQEYEHLRKDRTANLHEEHDVVTQRRDLKRSSVLESIGSSFKVNLVNEKLSHLFEGLQFVILSDKMDRVENIRIKADDMKVLVKKFGGQVKIKPKYGDKQCIIISEKSTPSCMEYLKQGYDIIHPDWIFHCIEYNKIIDLETAVIYASENTHRSNADQYGDSYSITPRIPYKEYFHLITGVYNNYNIEDIPELQERRVLCQLFQNTSFLVVDLEMNVTKERLATKITQFHGKIVTDIPCDYIVVPNSILKAYRSTTLKFVKQILARIAENYMQYKAIPNIVSESFLDESIRTCTKVDAADHPVI